MNNIPQEQNTPYRLELLAAQRQLYSDAKNLQMISTVLAVPIVILLSILVAIFPQLAVYAALWGILITLLDFLVFSRQQKSIQETAANIQQIFDCEVLQLDLNRLNSGNRVEPESIFDASSRYKRKNLNYTALENWYPISIEKLPIEQARIICQRSNIRWDSRLRRRYSKWVIIIIISLSVIVFIIGLFGGMTLEKFLLAVLAPLTPAFVLGLRQYTEHNQAAAKLSRLQDVAENIIQEVSQKILSLQDIDRKSYILQSQIYDNRRYSPLIFDWIYSRLRRESEEQMNKGAEVLIKELNLTP